MPATPSHHYMRDGTLDHDRQEYDGRFKLIFAATAFVHLLLLGGLVFVSLSQPSKREENIVWVNPGSFGGNPETGEIASAGNPELTPPPSADSNETGPPEMEKPPEPSPPEPTPALSTPPPPTPLAPKPPAPTAPPPTVSPTDSELAVRTPTPPATPRPTPKPLLSPTPRPSPKPKPSPKPSPTPKASPKPSASPKQGHKPEPTPKEKPKEKPEAEKSPKPETSPKSKASPVKPDGENKSKALADSRAHSGEQDKQKPSKGQTAGESPGTSRANGGGGHGEGSGPGSGDSALAAYVGILTSRFQAAWNQPTGELAMGKTLEVTVKLKVEPDGKVTQFSIVEGSGNAVVDESVREAGKSITKLPPPPNKEAFSAPVRFELGN